MAPRPIVADACALLNLLATGREADLLRALGWRLICSEQAIAQTQYLYSLPDDEGTRTRIPANTNALRAADLLESPALEGHALDVFVELAATLDDADASCVALAVTLQVPLLTDDAKVRRIARDAKPAVPEIISTLSCLRDATQALRVDDAERVALAQALRWRGNFLPPRSDDLREWYVALLERATER